jgi:GGDEF domain-containing protein
MIVAGNVGVGKESSTDPLTGLGTRAELMLDLAESIDPTSPARTLALFDFAGLSEYADLYGRLEGQALLVRLADRLSEALEQPATYYRPRSGEFAALIETSIATAEPLLLAAVSTLTIRFEQFEITPTFGAALLPDEASDPVDALMLADQRLFLNTLARRARERRHHPRGPRSS